MPYHRSTTSHHSHRLDARVILKDKRSKSQIMFSIRKTANDTIQNLISNNHKKRAKTVKKITDKIIESFDREHTSINGLEFAETLVEEVAGQSQMHKNKKIKQLSQKGLDHELSLIEHLHGKN